MFGLDLPEAIAGIGILGVLGFFVAAPIIIIILLLILFAKKRTGPIDK